MSIISIARNTAFMTAASIGQKIISFAYFTLIARHLGAASTGKYFFALSFTTIFVVFVDLGLTNVLVREAAKMKDKLQIFFSTVLYSKIFLGILSYIAAFFVINWLGYSVEIKQLVYLSAVTMLFDSIHLSNYGVLRAIGNLKYEAIGIVVSQLITLILGTAFLYLDFSLIYLMVAFAIPSILNVIYSSLVLRIKYQIRLVARLDKQVLKHFSMIAIPFALAAIFARVYSYIDSILLSKLIGNEAVGWYSIPYKITYAFQFIPLALVAALYPRFSEHFAGNKERLVYIFHQGIKYLMIIVFPVAIGISVLANDIIISLYTIEYANSIMPLRILLAGLVFSYISFPIGAFLNACNKQVIQTIIVFSVMVINIILNIALIPKYGVIGASIAALVGNCLLTFVGYVFVRRIAPISSIFFGKSVIQIGISAMLMGLLVFLVNNYVNYLFAILAGAVVYPLLLVATRAITQKQIREAFVLIRKQT